MAVDHPISIAEVVEHSLTLFESGAIDIEDLARVVEYAAEALGMSDVAETVRRNPRTAVRMALRIVDTYLTLRHQLPVLIHVPERAIVDLLKKIVEDQEDGTPS